MASARLKPVTIQPRQDAVDDTIPPGPNVRANSAFTLVHYHGWDFHERTADHADEWLPRLNEVRHSPGCNGVKWEGSYTNGRANPALALGGAVNKGGIVITPQDRRLGEFVNYLAAHKVRGGGAFYVLRCVEIVLLNGGKSAVLAPDQDWNRRFRRHLYESNIVPRMPREALDAKIAILDGRLSRYRALFNAGKVTIDSWREKQRETEDFVARYTEAYAAVAADDLPSDEHAPVMVAKPAAVETDVNIEKFAGKTTRRPPGPKPKSMKLTPKEPTP